MVHARQVDLSWRPTWFTEPSSRTARAILETLSQNKPKVLIYLIPMKDKGNYLEKEKLQGFKE